MDSQPADGWTQNDEYLWYTCDIVADVVTGQAHRRPLVASTARIEAGERVLATGPGDQYRLRAVGNGSYRSTGVAAIGKPGFVVGALALNALGNAARRKRAQQDTVPRWVHDGGGELTITHLSAYLAHPRNPLSLGFTGLDQIDLPEPGVFEARYHDMYGKGYMCVRVTTPWASLMFALAALAAFPSHPRLLGGTWLPPGFEARCAHLGRAVRPVQQLVLTQGRG
ncbi:hypothetical protein OG948_40770 (plasmid) [Embleya sp. NBC_00888]|uniref:hypothetical protein n=1 Tax=Embleya sp. NBC_00888 TaxID=2975960 RepID=UPI002F913428|nr:hypothetical protein OG948_40770 [Embleya sp. NBC_00888]